VDRADLEWESRHFLYTGPGSRMVGGAAVACDNQVDPAARLARQPGSGTAGVARLPEGRESILRAPRGASTPGPAEDAGCG
jgi:hypothetical protein